MERNAQVSEPVTLIVPIRAAPINAIKLFVVRNIAPDKDINYEHLSSTYLIDIKTR